MRFLITQAGKADLKSIGRYTWGHWGIKQRDAYLAKIFKGFTKLVKSPLLAKPRDELFSGLRSIHIEKHVVYYYHSDREIRIIGVLHERMDPVLHRLSNKES